MNTSKHDFLFIGIFVGLLFGLLITNKDGEVYKLQTELQKARQKHLDFENSKAHLFSVAKYRRPTPPFPLPNIAPTNVIQHPFGITEQDIQSQRSLAERKLNGEYILLNESPTRQKPMEVGRKYIANLVASNNAAKLSHVFEKPGVAPEISRELQYHQEKIAEAALSCESAVEQLVVAKDDYDKRVRAIMSQDDYLQYRAYENSQMANREYEQIRAYAVGKGVVVDGEYQTALSGLIQQANGYTSEYYLGPYDDIPQPSFGIEGMRKLLTSP